ncbi:HAMP domain-containing sensor histidine kinase [uncultured Sulfitobacter sp.]|uniref:sensor histidine kinase n=1 Tax=uncultured Sulfitobacter sp. TaxID=191468 RepID=UPI00260FF185|nr:HAMP domain-containing sensor histidine kinase [uncultured Sulfitobacter sp.]
MRKPTTSLLNTLFKSLLLPGIVAAVLGVLIVHSLVKEEYDELQDLSLISKAHLLLQVFEARNPNASASAQQSTMNPLAFEPALMEPDEQSAFWILDADDDVIARSIGADDTLLAARVQGGIITDLGYRIADVSRADTRLSVVTAVPMIERNEAIRDVLIGVSTGFVLLGLFVAFAAYRAVRRTSDVIVDLSAEIGSKNAHDLSPVDRKNTFTEIEPAIDKIDALMGRLDATLIAERAFATNAAHELRTPVAISLAHVQRLRAKLSDPVTSESALEIEQGLKRLTRLIERLLQMSRAQSGLGTAATPADIAPVINLLMRELRDRVPSPERLVMAAPEGEWKSAVDPDAIGIMLNNLFENALKHATGNTPMQVDASTKGRIVVSNDCAALAPDALEKIKQRFVRNAASSEGFGLGLSIVRELCKQSGSTLELASPCVGKKRGFSATLTLPIAR